MSRIHKAVESIGLTIEDAEMFSQMVTHKDFSALMDKSQADDTKNRLGSHSMEDLLKAKKKAETHRLEISHCLCNMDESLHMVFKVNNYLRAIDFTLGSPVNNYYYTVSNCVFLQILTPKIGKVLLRMCRHERSQGDELVEESNLQHLEKLHSTLSDFLEQILHP
jgi:hypothetical protein